jgi:hypothetical protein
MSMDGRHDGRSMRPPKYQKKTDRVIHGKATKAEIECDMLLAPLSAETDRMNEKWGIDRLPTLVGIEMAEKWGKACAGLIEAVEANDPERTKAWVIVCLRGLKALDHEASLNPANTRLPDIWDCEHDGERFVLIRDHRHWKMATKLRPASRIYTIGEVSAALKYAQTRVVDAVKDVFPGSQIAAIRETDYQPFVDDDLDDIFGKIHSATAGEQT